MSDQTRFDHPRWDPEQESLKSFKEPTDGESYDKNGNIRPVPPGVDNTPEEDHE